MTIEEERIGKATVVLTLNGRLDTVNVPLLESKLKTQEGITEFTLDFKEIDYISSMGLRVLLHAKKSMKEEGVSLNIIHMQEHVHEIFEMTGFLNLMEKVDEAVPGQ